MFNNRDLLQEKSGITAVPMRSGKLVNSPPQRSSWKTPLFPVYIWQWSGVMVLWWCLAPHNVPELRSWHISARRPWRRTELPQTPVWGKRGGGRTNSLVPSCYQGFLLRVSPPHLSAFINRKHVTILCHDKEISNPTTLFYSARYLSLPQLCLVW